ncbi:AMP-binding protein [Terracidiphilus gabretensis]|uniref:AMP-binding protein n=1 Tax=Terracidiphilus gabretensis TaxID=1577687 RepID=UPI00071BF6E9|nr:AMP-binding protein [Terracidiphilus gabretensis]
MREHLATLVEDFRRYGHEIAVVRTEGNRRRAATYGEIANLAGRFAALLEAHHVAPGDRVLIWGENSAEWVAAFHGCILRGALAVPLDAFGSAEFAARIAADVQPRVAVGDANLLKQLPSDADHHFPLIAFENWPTALPQNELGPVQGLNRETPLQILFTSGTTGDPKGIVHTHGNVLASIGPIEQAAQSYMRYEKYVHPLRFLHTLPLSHVFGQTMGLWIPPIFRAEVHFESRLVAPRLIETIQRERISVLAAVPRVFALLKTHLEASIPNLSKRVAESRAKPAGKFGWKRWWWFRKVHRAFGFKFWALISGGGALSPSVEEFWNALGFVLVQGYGMTETTALITLNHPFRVAKGTIGKPLPGREVKIGADGEVLVRGPMISSATWSGGELHQRQDEWLSTGDLAEAQETGELKFLGRKSEVIVTASGVNIHPEDLEAIIEQQPGVVACAVVALETPSGPEPCAVLAMRGASEGAPDAIEQANTRLADFQRVRRWLLWPEPDLPRTTTGKVRRKAVSEWVHSVEAARLGLRSETAFAPSSDWLLHLIAGITGETPHNVGDELRLDEDLHLDSLGRVQLAAAIEQKLGMPPESGFLEEIRTLGELRALAGGVGSISDSASSSASQTRQPSLSSETSAAPIPAAQRNYTYSLWPWIWPVQTLRVVFQEAIAQPLTWFLAAPRVTAPADLRAALHTTGPMLIIANHISAYDGPLVQYALPGKLRRHLATAMSGEMLDDMLHFRNPERGPRYGKFSPFGPIAWFLATVLYNVFPLPRTRDFQRSFTHAGHALDRGFNVLVFPEGTRSESGKLAPFRQGIGLLVKQSGVPVLPVALLGLGDLKQKGRGWFRSGKIEIRVGEPIRFDRDVTEAQITELLHAETQRLLTQ